MEEVNEKIINKAIKQYQEFEIEAFKKFDTGAARKVIEVKSKGGKELIIYLCTKENVEQRFEKEELLIDLVNQKTNIPTPEILHSDFSKEEIPYLFYIGEKIEGYNPVNRYKYLPEKQRNNILRNSAKYLAELHENVKFENKGDIIYNQGEIEIDSSTCYDYIREWAEEWIQKIEKKQV